MTLSLTPSDSNYPCPELISMVPKIIEPLKFDFYSKEKTSVFIPEFLSGSSHVHYILCTDFILNIRTRLLLTILVLKCERYYTTRDVSKTAGCVENRTDPDQTPQNASDPGLNYLSEYLACLACLGGQIRP